MKKGGHSICRELLTDQQKASGLGWSWDRLWGFIALDLAGGFSPRHLNQNTGSSFNFVCVGSNSMGAKTGEIV